MNMIFHHPFPLIVEGRSGSSVRPRKMLEAFRANGYEVEAVTGHATERRRAIERLRTQLAGGRRFDFAYSETHTLPSALTEPHHLPLNPRLDSGLLTLLNRARVPVGLFYRDIHWRFGRSLSFESPVKRTVTAAFHRLEWRTYTARVDHLFLPSLAMAGALLSAWPAERLSALPPGGDPVTPTGDAVPVNSDQVAQSAAVPSRAPLQLLYVGGVKPPLYDLTPLFETAAAVPSAAFTLCCREEEWVAVRDGYKLPANLTVVHRSGQQLAELYSTSDAVAILWREHPYLEFAMPVKLMEAIAFGRPIITLGSSELARFVERHEVGWVVDSIEDAASLITRLGTEPGELAAATDHVVAARPHHTWQARAEQVARTLTAVHE